MRQGEDQRSKGHNQHSDAEISGLATKAAEVADGNEAEHGCDVVAARDRPRLRAAQAVAVFDVGDDDVDETVHDHSLKIYSMIQSCKKL